MPRHKTGEDDAPSDDIGWKFAIPVPNNRHKLNCRLCGREVNGGITRLKQHLAHQKGQISGCPSVTTEIREQMMNHLLGFKEKKLEKRKQRDEVAEHIRASQRDENDDDLEGFVVSSDDSDPEMTHARQVSMKSQREWEERQRFKTQAGGRYDTGGSSRAGGSGLVGGQVPRGTRRSVSVREPGTKNWTDLSTPESRLAEIDVELHRSKSAKQPKISTKVMKTLRKKLGVAVSQFVIYGRMSANAVASPWLEPMLDVAREVGKGVKPPTPYEVTEVYLPREFDALRKWIESHKPIWEERGVTIMCDGWTGPTRRHIINFLIYSNRGTVFHKSIDATDIPSRTSDYYFSLMDRVVEEIGEKYVVQIVTDNEAAIKLGGKKLMQKRPQLYWTACAAHCIDLMLHDIGKKKSVEKVLSQARKITSFIYNSNWVVDFMKRFTEGRELLRPAVTRFATNFIALESIVRYKQALKEMFNSEEWNSSRWAKKKEAKEVKKIIFGNDFWSKSVDIMKVQEPLVKVLRLVDGDEKPTMGFIYEAMDRAKLAIQKDCRYYKDFWKLIDKRWNFQLHHDLHAAGYFFNPQFQYGGALSNHREIMDGVKKVISRLEPNIDSQIRAINQILIFRDKQDSFGTVLAQRAIQQTNPAEWWIHYGTSAPELQQIAVKVLSQTTSSSNCERNWSTFSLIHTKTRNRLKNKKLNTLVYAYYNMRLKIRHATRRSQKEMEEQFNPINLDYIFEEDDPLAPWLQEREEPLLDNQDNSDWLHINSDDDQEEATTHPHRGSQISSTSANESGSGGGLSPPSGGSGSSGRSGPSGGNGGGQGQIGQYEVGAFGHRDSSSSPFRGEYGIHGFRPNEEIGDVPQQQRRSSDVGGSRRHAHRSSDDDSYDDRDIMHRFRELGVGGHQQVPQNYPPRPTYPYPYPPPQYYYPPPHVAYPPPQYYPPPPYSTVPPPLQSYGHGFFEPLVPYGYYEQQQRQEESSGSSNHDVGAYNYFGVRERPREQAYNDDDNNRDYEEPARHSFWW